MSKTASLTLTLSLSGDGFAASPIFATTVTNLSGIVPGSVATSAGFTTIAVPSAAIGVVIVPPVGSTLVKTYKGITGDTGIATDPAGPVFFKWTPGQIASFGVLSTGAETLSLLWL
jgi:hypothetical protein